VDDIRNHLGGIFDGNSIGDNWSLVIYEFYYKNLGYVKNEEYIYFIINRKL